MAGDRGRIQVRASVGLALAGVEGIALLGNLLEPYTGYLQTATRFGA